MLCRMNGNAGGLAHSERRPEPMVGRSGCPLRGRFFRRRHLRRRLPRWCLFRSHLLRSHLLGWHLLGRSFLCSCHHFFLRQLIIVNVTRSVARACVSKLFVCSFGLCEIKPETDRGAAGLRYDNTNPERLVGRILVCRAAGLDRACRHHIGSERVVQQPEDLPARAPWRGEGRHERPVSTADFGHLHRQGVALGGNGTKVLRRIVVDRGCALVEPLHVVEGRGVNTFSLHAFDLTVECLGRHPEIQELPVDLRDRAGQRLELVRLPQFGWQEAQRPQVHQQKARKAERQRYCDARCAVQRVWVGCNLSRQPYTGFAGLLPYGREIHEAKANDHRCQPVGNAFKTGVRTDAAGLWARSGSRAARLARSAAHAWSAEEQAQQPANRKRCCRTYACDDSTGHGAPDGSARARREPIDEGHDATQQRCDHDHRDGQWDLRVAGWIIPISNSPQYYSDFLDSFWARTTANGLREVVVGIPYVTYMFEYP